MGSPARTLEASFRALPAKSLRAERALLGALMVANAKDRDAATTNLTTSDFSDPWYQWVFRVLRHFRRREWTELPREFLREYRESPPRLGGRDVEAELCLILIRRDGVADCGRVDRIRRLVCDLRGLSTLRKNQERLEAELAQAIAATESLVRETEEAL